jgi:hypothetical protein
MTNSPYEHLTEAYQARREGIPSPPKDAATMRGGWAAAMDYLPPMAQSPPKKAYAHTPPESWRQRQFVRATN